MNDGIISDRLRLYVERIERDMLIETYGIALLVQGLARVAAKHGRGQLSDAMGCATITRRCTSRR
jgi:hypothetical protein